MPNEKYCFTGETKVVFGVVLRQIRALVSFGTIVSGEVGGWIEDEKNLARVSGDAWVSGNARVSGDAWVSGNADLFFAAPLGSRRACLTIHSDIEIGIRFTTGCFSGTEHQFKKAIQKTHGDNDFARQYLAAINLALVVVKSAKVAS